MRIRASETATLSIMARIWFKASEFPIMSYFLLTLFLGSLSRELINAYLLAFFIVISIRFRSNGFSMKSYAPFRMASMACLWFRDRNHDYRGICGELLDTFQYFDTFHFGHLYIAETMSGFSDFTERGLPFRFQPARLRVPRIVEYPSSNCGYFSHHQSLIFSSYYIFCLTANLAK